MSVGSPGFRAIGGEWFRCDPWHGRSALSLVCLPHAGGGASAFRHWRTRLPDRVGVLAAQYPGHEGRWADPLCVSAGDLVASLADALTRSVSGDVVLFGHSFGALVAFELTRALRGIPGLRVRHLFVSGSRPPDTALSGPEAHAWPDRELLDYVVELGGMPAELLAQRVLTDMFLPCIRADLRMDESYRYVPALPLECPITAFAGESDPMVTMECVDGWRRHTTHGFQLIPLRTGHFWTPECTAAALAIVDRVLRGVIDARESRSL